MAGKADVQTHLNLRRPSIEGLFSDWSASDLSSGDRLDVIESYFKASEIGEIQRAASGNSIHVSPTGIDAKRANIMIVGRHDVADLSEGSAAVTTGGALVGPGVASRLGPTVAFAEGFLAARSLTVNGPINASFVSLGPGDSLSDVTAALFTGNLDAVYLTDAVSWNPHHPTITVGSRGRLVVELHLDAGQPSNDFITAGAVRNPLAKMTQILGAIRNERGQIAVPGFYDRALTPDPELRAALADDDYNANEWSEHLGVARFNSGLSTLERASLWPGASVLGLEAAPQDGSRMPTSVKATLALYMVPDQRHAEIERSLRTWFINQAPAELHPSMKVLASSRPWRCDPDSLPVAAQARAAFQLHGRHPVPVAAGGPSGAGEVAFAVGVPIGFAGIARPSTSWGTQAESLSWTHFDAGVALAAETCLQLRRA